MTIRKTFGLIILTIGLYFCYGTFKSIYERHLIGEIKKNGRIINSIVSFTDCSNSNIVKFRVPDKNEEIEFVLDSDCGLFTVGQNQNLLYFDKYPKKYIFPNESISTIAVYLYLGLTILFFLIALILFKKNKPAANSGQKQ
jgi:hypothetical protein